MEIHDRKQPQVRPLRRWELNRTSISKRSQRTKDQPNRAIERAFAFAATASRSRGGVLVVSELSISCAAAATRSTASMNASSFTFDGLFIPDSFLTNCRADAFTSSVVAGGSKLNSVFIFLHTASFLLLHWIPFADNYAVHDLIYDRAAILLAFSVDGTRDLLQIDHKLPVDDAFNDLNL